MATTSYKCPNCGGGLVFDPAAQDFACEYCLGHFTEADLPPAPEAQAAPPEEGALMLYSCPNCGAEVSVDATTAATVCYYCHNPVVLVGQLEGSYRPDKVIPFAIPKEQAAERFLAWVREKWFVPKGFFSKKQIDTITGVYFPYWLVDSDLKAELYGKATKRRVWRAGDIEHTETHHFRVGRRGVIHFEDITKNALNKETSHLCEGVHPFESAGMKDYIHAYLAGFQAEKRNLEQADVLDSVNLDINTYAKKLLADTITGYSTVSADNFMVGDVRLHWDYALLPVWTLTYKGHDGKIYFYTMNGQTGKITGVLPLNRGRLALVMGVVALAAGILVGALLMGGGLL